MKPRKTPCATCPYRLDAPSGLWGESEYAKLPRYDGEIVDQIEAQAFGAFTCHTDRDKFCAGWIATHGPDNLLALRLHADLVEEETFDYTTDVPLHPSGAAAAKWGLRDMTAPSERTLRAINKLRRVHPDLKAGDNDDAPDGS